MVHTSTYSKQLLSCMGTISTKKKEEEKKVCLALACYFHYSIGIPTVYPCLQTLFRHFLGNGAKIALCCLLLIPLSWTKEKKFWSAVQFRYFLRSDVPLAAIFLLLHYTTACVPYTCNLIAQARLVLYLYLRPHLDYVTQSYDIGHMTVWSLFKNGLGPLKTKFPTFTTPHPTPSLETPLLFLSWGVLTHY